MKPSFSTAATAAVFVLVTAASAAAAPLSPAARCEVGKLKAVGTYAQCRLKAEATALAKALAPDFSRCESKINTKFPKLEDAAGDMVCPSEDDLGDMRDRSDDFAEAVAILLSGGTIPVAGCGDGIVDLGEDCDIGTLDGETCATQGFYNGTLACDPGCSFVTTGCNPDRFEDTGTTVIDHETGLEWEKKGGDNGMANLADPHDVDNTYAWSVAGSNTTQSGSLYSSFLAALNGAVVHATTTTTGCYAGHCDWRIPTIDELKSIAEAVCGGAPCVVDPLLLPMRSDFYWSNSTCVDIPTGAYVVQFMDGGPTSDLKTIAHRARAVRTAN